MLQTLIDNAAAHERLLERMLADVPDVQMYAQPPGLPNHPAWLVGHLAVMRGYVAKALGHEAHVPEAWAALFNRGTSPTGDAQRYPQKSELLATFKQLNSLAREALGATPAARLAEESPAAGLRPMFPTVGHLVLGLLTLHDGLHLGQLGDWRRAMRLPRIL